jgi:hypothetical protein
MLDGEYLYCCLVKFVRILRRGETFVANIPFGPN